MQNRIPIIVFIVGSIIVLVLAVIVVFLATNTHFLNFQIPTEEIAENNSNFAPIFQQPPAEPEPEVEITVPTVTQSVLEHELNLPEGFEISVFAQGLSAPRMIEFTDNNQAYVTERDGGRVSYLPDAESDGINDRVVTVDSGLRNPSGLDFFEGDLYVAAEDSIIAYRDIDGSSYFRKDILVSGLPVGFSHRTRTIEIGPDRKIYVTLGSSCNLCEESDQRLAAMVRYNLDGSGEEIYAKGLRNTVGFVFKDEVIWSVDNGRDRIGDELPPEKVNIIEQGKHYGWPYCYGDRIANPEYPDKGSFCTNETKQPAYEMQAHSAPLGINFGPDSEGSNFPAVLSDNLFIAFHGSWNRTVPTGYKIVRIDTSDSTSTSDFITGWLLPNGTSWGRPADVEFDQNGFMYISDDVAGVVYRVEYKG